LSPVPRDPLLRLNIAPEPVFRFHEKAVTSEWSSGAFTFALPPGLHISRTLGKKFPPVRDKLENSDTKLRSKR